MDPEYSMSLIDDVKSTRF